VDWQGGEVSGTLPAGSLLTLTGEGTIGDGHSLSIGGVIATQPSTRLRMEPQAELILQPGAAFKAGSILEVTSGASLRADGTVNQPVTFTSWKDDSVLGDTNHDGTDSTPGPGDWPGISISSARNVSLSHLDLRYAETAISVQLLDSMSITESDFVYNNAAISVAGTTDNDPVLGALACVPPYLSFINASRDWFGATGLPAPDIDLLSVIGAVIPDEYGSAFGAASTLAHADYKLFGADNTIPFSIYSCPELGIPPIPVTPVLVGETPASPLYPDPEA